MPCCWRWPASGTTLSIRPNGTARPMCFMRRPHTEQGSKTQPFGHRCIVKCLAGAAPMLIQFLAIIVTGLAVIAPAARLFELPGKIRMSGDDYFVVQRIYLGWW